MMMHFTSIAEQFNKLVKEGEFEILQEFDKRDLKDAYDMRNYIVHDYEGLNLSVLDIGNTSKTTDYERDDRADIVITKSQKAFSFLK